MKLIKCHISSFGKLKDFDYDFLDGINTINQKNGWGKTTFATFIKCMLYGINDSGKKIETSERLKYRPWNSTDKFGGYLLFENAGYEIKVERYFGKNKNDDTISITDNKTGKAFSCNTEIGQHIFKIDEGGFLATSYFSQNGETISSNQTITTKYNSILGIDNSVYSDNYLIELEKRVKEFKKKDSESNLSDLSREISEINAEIDKIRSGKETYDKLKAEYKKNEILKQDLKAQIKDKTELYKKSLEIEANKDKEETHRTLIEKRDKLKTERENSLKEFNGKTVSKDTINDIQRKIFRYNSLVESVKPTCQSEKKNNYATFFILTEISFVIALVGCIFSSYFLFCLILTVIFGTFWAISYFGGKSNNKETEYIKAQNERISAEQNTLRSEIDFFFSGLNFAHGEYLSKLEAVREKLYRLEILEKEIAEKENYIADIEKNLREFDKTEYIPSLKVKQELDQVERKAEELDTIINSQSTSIKRQEEYEDSLIELEREREIKEDKLKSLKEEYKILDLTKTFMEKADENLKARYKKPVEDAINKYLDLLIGEGKKLNIDVDFGVKVTENSGDRETSFYSQGMQNIFELCKRFALIDVLFENEKTFMILDDPFFNLDNEKTELAISLLKELSKNRQIVYLVCHNSREIV